MAYRLGAEGRDRPEKAMAESCITGLQDKELRDSYLSEVSHRVFTITFREKRADSVAAVVESTHSQVHIFMPLHQVSPQHLAFHNQEMRT